MFLSIASGIINILQWVGVGSLGLMFIGAVILAYFDSKQNDILR